MKRFVSVFLVVLMILSIGLATAEGMDFASMTDDELQTLVDGARNELAKRQLVAAEDTVLLERDGVTVYMTGEHRNSEKYLYLEVVVVNDSDKAIDVFMDSSSINGWDVFNVGVGDTSAGKKQKGEFTFSLEDADISTFEEVEEIEMELYLMDADEFERIGDTIPVTLNFNAERVG